MFPEDACTRHFASGSSPCDVCAHVSWPDQEFSKNATTQKRALNGPSPERKDTAHVSGRCVFRKLRVVVLEDGGRRARGRKERRERAGNGDGTREGGRERARANRGGSLLGEDRDTRTPCCSYSTALCSKFQACLCCAVCVKCRVVSGLALSLTLLRVWRRCAHGHSVWDWHLRAVALPRPEG